MAIQCLSGDAEFFADLAHLGFLLPHRGHRQSDLGRRHLERAAAASASRPSRGESGDSAFGDERAFELGEGREDAEHEFAGCCGGVDGRALTGEDFETDCHGR